ncbi:topbp1-A [Acrasis kona]|uniref:Topbp1-A n=1 Tax=Acrasis kona TaxID=1008807 RepID=A0AAW2ZDS5_9EUKA
MINSDVDSMQVDFDLHANKFFNDISLITASSSNHYEKNTRNIVTPSDMKCWITNKMNFKASDNKIVVAFTRFFQEGVADSALTRIDLSEKIKALGGSVLDSDIGGYSSSITHLIIPDGGASSLKTIGGVLEGKWIIRSKWIEQSARVERFVDETNFGYRYIWKPLREQDIYLSRTFLEEEQSYELKSLKVIEIGGGRPTDRKEYAKYWLVSKKEKIPGSYQLPETVKAVLTRDEFFDMIVPKEWNK